MYRLLLDEPKKIDPNISENSDEFKKFREKWLVALHASGIELHKKGKHKEAIELFRYVLDENIKMVGVHSFDDKTKNMLNLIRSNLVLQHYKYAKQSLKKKNFSEAIDNYQLGNQEFKKIDTSYFFQEPRINVNHEKNLLDTLRALQEHLEDGLEDEKDVDKLKKVLNSIDMLKKELPDFWESHELEKLRLQVTQKAYLHSNPVSTKTITPQRFMSNKNLQHGEKASENSQNSQDSQNLNHKHKKM